MGEATSAGVAGNSMHAGSRSSAVLLVETAGFWHIPVGFLHISYSMSEGIWGRVRDLGTDSLITTTVNLAV